MQATQFRMPTAVEGVLQHAPNVQQAPAVQPRQGLQNVPVERTVAVMPLVLRLVQHLGGALTAASSAALGARVLEVHTGKFAVDPVKRCVDKLCVAQSAPGGLYWYLGFDNYAI